MDWFLYDNGLCYERVNEKVSEEILIKKNFAFSFNSRCGRKIYTLSHGSF